MPSSVVVGWRRPKRGEYQPPAAAPSPRPAAQRSAAETATLNAAGRANAAAGIRSQAGDPGTEVVDKGTTTRDIIAAPEGDGQNARAAVPQQ